MNRGDEMKKNIFILICVRKSFFFFEKIKEQKAKWYPISKWRGVIDLFSLLSISKRRSSLLKNKRKIMKRRKYEISLLKHKKPASDEEKFFKIKQQTETIFYTGMRYSMAY